MGIRVRVLGGVAAGALLLVSAEAASMSFKVNGTAPNGAAYDGTVTLEELNDTGASGEVGKVTWTFGGSTVSGLAMGSTVNKKVLTVAFPGDNGVAGIMIITQQADGSAKGEWLSASAGKIGTETWTPMAAADSGATAPAAAGGGAASDYDRAIKCAAATGYVVSFMRGTPGSDSATIKKYDDANSAWVLRLGDVAGDKTLDQRTDDIRAYQNNWATADDGMAQATTVADDCVAHPPPAN